MAGGGFSNDDDYDYSSDFSSLNNSDNDTRIPRYRMYGDSGDVEEDEPEAILVIAILLTFCIGARWLMVKYLSFLPYQLFLLAVSGVIAAVIYNSQIDNDVYKLVFMQSPMMLEKLLIPVVILRTTFIVDYFCLRRSISQLMVIAVVRLLGDAALLSLLMQGVTRQKQSTTQMFLYGVLTAPTFPTSIVALLRDVGTFQHLCTLIEMEAIMSLCVTRSMMQLALGLQEEVYSEWYHVVTFLIRNVLFAMLVGQVVGKAGAWLLNKYYSRAEFTALLMLSLCYMIFALSHSMGVSSYISLAIAGITISNVRANLTADVERSILNFLDAFLHVVYSITFVMVHVIAISACIEFATENRFAAVVILYIASNFVRAFTFLAIYPIISRIGYGMTMPVMLIMSMANCKDLPHIILAMYPWRSDESLEVNRSYVIDLVCLEVLTLINSMFMRTVLKLFGLFEISYMRRNNMNNCLRYIYRKRALFLPLLKCNKFYASANWDAINTATQITHPYKIKMSDDDDEGNLASSREATCPECHRSFFVESNSKDDDSIQKEIHNRIMKAKWVSFTRQYENGTLSKIGKWHLLYQLELTRFGKAFHTKYNLRSYFNHPKLMCMYVSLKTLQIGREHKIPAPKHKHRRTLYYMVMHNCFDMIVYLVVLFQLFLGIVNYMFELNGVLFVYMFLSFHLCLLFFWIEFCMKVIGYSSVLWCLSGIYYYFSIPFNIIDFCLLINLTIARIFDISDILSYPEQYAYLGKYLMAIKDILDLVNIYYAVRVLKLVGTIATCFINIIDDYINSVCVLGYDIGKAVIACDDELLENLDTLVDDPHYRSIIKTGIEERRTNIDRELAVIAKERPWVAVTVKSKQAIQSVITTLAKNVVDLKQTGYIDETEHQKLMESIESCELMAHSIKNVMPSAPKVIFKEISWMANNSEVIDFLYNNVVVQSVDTNQVVCSKGRASPGIFVVISGLLRLQYTPPTDLELEFLDVGALPIIDYIQNAFFNYPIEDHIVSGNSFGELSVLTGRPYSSDVIAESAAKLYLLSETVIDDAFQKFPDSVTGLQSAIWKSCCYLMATNILKSTSHYLYQNAEHIRQAMDRSFVPDLRHLKSVYITELIQDVILLDGVVIDTQSKQVFLAPMCIPRTSQRLTLNKAYMNLGSRVDAVLLVIPMKNIDPHKIMDRMGKISDTTTNEMQEQVRKSMRRKSTVHRQTKYSSR